jgi:hypothetical protein
MESKASRVRAEVKNSNEATGEVSLRGMVQTTGRKGQSKTIPFFRPKQLLRDNCDSSAMLQLMLSGASNTRKRVLMTPGRQDEHKANKFVELLVPGSSLNVLGCLRSVLH